MSLWGRGEATETVPGQKEWSTEMCGHSLRVTGRVREGDKNKKETNGPFQGHNGWVMASETEPCLREGQRQDASRPLRWHTVIYP